MTALVRVEGLNVTLPGGSPIVEATDVFVAPGTVTSILGPSGAGKTTILRALLAPEELRSAGYVVSWTARHVGVEPAFVPQRGALLDHLDVADNIALAQAGGGLQRDAMTWLRAVDLDDAMGAPGRAVSSLSGGQAQRVAVARVLAAGRRLIVMDEPSVGLDPLGVRMLARLLVKQARKHQAGIIIITHDLSLAAGASDQILFLDPSGRRLHPLLPTWGGPAEFDDNKVRLGKLSEVEAAIEHLLLREKPKGSTGSRRAGMRFDPLAPFRVAGDALLRGLHPKLFGESAVVFRRTLVQALVRPVLFYATVGMLLGFTVPYIVANISADLRPAAVFQLIKGTHILSLAPPLSAIVFAATSGSAINAWLGGLRLHGQVTALEGLGVTPARYLWSPAWIALALGYLGTFVVFTLSMIGGGWILYDMSGVKEAFAVLSADFINAPPSRYPYLARCVWLVFAYTFAISSIVVAKGREEKSRSEDVTNAMTSSVMRATLFVVVMELVTVMLVRLWEGK